LIWKLFVRVSAAEDAPDETLHRRPNGEQNRVEERMEQKPIKA